MGSTPRPPARFALATGYRVRVKLRAAIAASLLFVTVSLAVAMTAINLRGSTSALRRATGALMRSSVGLVAAETEALLEQVGARVEVSAAVLAHDPGRLRVALDHVETLLFALVESGDDLYYAQLGAADGRFVLVSRNEEGGLDTKWIANGQTTWIYRGRGQNQEEAKRRAEVPPDGYAPRLRPWFRGAVETDGLFWTRAYAHADDGVPVVTAARAIRDREGEVVGVVSATLALSHLNRYLQELSASKAVIFVADERNQLVALSEGQLHIRRESSTALRLPRITEAPLSQVAAVTKSEVFRADAEKGDALAVDRIEVGKDAYLVVGQALTPMAGRDWMVGAVVEEARVLGEVRRSIRMSALVALVVIGVFVLLGLVLARTLAGPLLAIAQETRRIRKLDLEDRRLDPSRFEEIAEIQEAYADMKVGLRAFEKYVPGKLVRTLLDERVDPAPGGREEELTLFFSDIRGFTSFAHSVSTKELAAVLSRYLEAIVSEIDRTGGTIDKFVGDGVMAFWNAPRAVERHPIEAVRAAIRCRDAIRSMARSEVLFTRIGIHTGTALVGNFGSPSRFAYTVLGDAVNLASRLEGVNKVYGTQITVSAATEEKLDGSIVRRRLDRVSVSGRRAGVDLYEILGFAGAVDASTLDRARRYEEALAVYFERRFEQAEGLFERLNETDPAAQVMKARCAQYRASPPPPTWDGVHAIERK